MCLNWSCRTSSQNGDLFPAILPDLPFWSVSCTHLLPAACWLCQPTPTSGFQFPSSDSPFLSLPVDLQLEIFCLLPTVLDVARLSATCGFLRSIFQYNPTSVLRPVLARSIDAYPDALRAARGSLLNSTWPGSHFDLATNTYTSPPTASFCSTLSIAPATLTETTTVCRLVALVRCLQSAWDNTESEGIELGLNMITVVPGAQERFHRGCYRFLFMGYLFAGAYLEPLTAVDNATRNRYPMYSTDIAWRTERVLELVGGFMDWIIADGEEQGRIAGLEDVEYISTREIVTDTNPAERRFVSTATQGSIAEIMLLFTMSEALPPKFGIDDSNVGFPILPRAPFYGGEQDPTIGIRMLDRPYSYTITVPHLNTIPGIQPDIVVENNSALYRSAILEIALERYFRMRIVEGYFSEGNQLIVEFKRGIWYVRTGGVDKMWHCKESTLWPLEPMWKGRDMGE